METVIVCLSGKMGAGKSTVAGILTQYLNEVTVVTLPFAKPLKDFATQLGWDGRKDAKGRRLLQLLGTECGRECISETIWVDKWLEQVKELEDVTSGKLIIIVDDCRFQAEYDFLLNIGRPVFTFDIRRKLKFKERFPFLLHKSERGVKMRADFVIDNTSSISHLGAQLGNPARIIKELL